MSGQCVMCDAPVRTGRILCEDCELPRQKRSSHPATPPAGRGKESAIPALSIDGLAALFTATGLEAILLGSEGVEYVSPDARESLLDSGEIDQTGIERLLSVDLSTTADGVYAATLDGRSRQFVLATIAPGMRAIGVIPAGQESRAPHIEFLREAVIDPLRSLSQSVASEGTRRSDTFLRDAAMTIDQALSSLELSPDLGSGEEQEGDYEDASVEGILRKVRSRFSGLADQKMISLTLDVNTSSDESIADGGALGEALATYVENSLRYTPAGGQVVLGVREMEHKGKPVFLFFTMDNGAVVPENYREAIFSPGFVWDPVSPIRTGRDLAQCRRFAVRHGGKAWVESRTGRACTFYLTIAR